MQWTTHKPHLPCSLHASPLPLAPHIYSPTCPTLLGALLNASNGCPYALTSGWGAPPEGAGQRLGGGRRGRLVSASAWLHPGHYLRPLQWPLGNSALFLAIPHLPGPSEVKAPSHSEPWGTALGLKHFGKSYPHFHKSPLC